MKQTLKKLWLKLLSTLAGIAPAVGEIILDALRIGSKDLLGDAVTILLPIVMDLEGSKLPGSEKRDVALERARIAAMNRGLEFSGRILNSALELAVLKISEPKP